jgi:hypothetical protein
MQLIISNLIQYFKTTHKILIRKIVELKSHGKHTYTKKRKILKTAY